MIKAVIFDYAGTVYNPFSKKPYPDALVSRAANPAGRRVEIVPVQSPKEFTHIYD